jgi:hypothetical protein
MRCLISILTVLGLAQQSFAAWSLVNHASAGAATTGAPSVATARVNMTGADTLFASVNIYNQNPNGSCTVTDSVGLNTWHLAASQYVSGHEANLALFYAYNAAVSSNMSATITCGASTYAGMTFWGFSGGLTTSDPLDTSATRGSITSSGQTNWQPGAATAASGELTISAVGVGGGGATIASINDMFSLIDSVNYVGGNNEANGAAYFVSTGSALNPVWTITPGNCAAAVIASFRSPTSSGPAPPPPASGTAPAVVF